MIFILEDDDSIRKLVSYGLESQGYSCQGFGKPSEFRKALEHGQPELVLLDIMLPEEDGLSVLQKLRRDGRTAGIPVIMMTAKNTEYDRVVGLDSGADDFICKPFGMMELVARVRAVLRRARPSCEEKRLCVGCLSVSPARHEVLVSGKEVLLTHKEFHLLTLLLEHVGLVLTREILMNRIWGVDQERENRTLDVHIRTLRTKLGEAGAYIETVRGVGYRMRDNL